MTILEALRTVTTSIKTWAESKFLTQHIVYVGPDRPTDAHIKVWVNTSEDYDEGAIAMLPVVTTIELNASGWIGSGELYSQAVTVNGVTANSKIDLQPTATQIISLADESISLVAENDGGSVTVYAIGGVPSVDYSMQALITEVSVL